MIDFKNFKRPQRYIGNEWNAIVKRKKVKLRICICYPDIYEIGMSNLGIKIIYSLLNKYPHVACERVFMPADDMAEFISQGRKKLFSLETKTPLDEFDILGIHLGYELNFTNFLSILELGGIPLKASDRKKTIVMGGGIVNPEPLAEFVDLFFLGEFEEAADEFIGVLKKYRAKEERLAALAQLDGFYVPKFYEVSFLNNTYHFEKKYAQAQLPIKRVYVKDLNNSHYPQKWLTPHTQIIHDRAQIEIARGCPNQCNFCQAKAVYSPYREKKLATITQLITKIYETSGYENFSLLSLSASDHSEIAEIIDSSYDFFKSKRIGLSLPSLRIDDIVGRLYSKLLLLKKTSLTVAVEAANDPLRRSLNKKIDIKKLFEAAKIIKNLGVRYMKIYFMFGFRQESEEDLSAIGQFLNALNKSSGLALKASINIFIPKPFSCWQNFPMEEEKILENKRRIILSYIPRRRNIKISLAFLKKSILEAIISRADRKFSSVIYRAYTKGAKFDGYRENFSWNIWEDSMKEEGIDYRFYLDARTDNFPWSFIETANMQMSNNSCAG